jgi:succinate dehydrogenase hydrophobic anchor subunit
MHAAGRHAHLHNLVLNPFWRFLRGYVLRAGFMDGWRGFLFACMEADYVREKFARLWLMQHAATDCQNDRSPKPAPDGADTTRQP